MAPNTKASLLFVLQNHIDAFSGIPFNAFWERSGVNATTARKVACLRAESC